MSTTTSGDSAAGGRRSVSDHAVAVPVVRGLDDAGVAERRAAGRVNEAPRGTGRTVAGIVRANIFTRFNAILGALLAVVLVIGAWRDALFGIVLVSNAAIGIVQELRAKWTLDRLSVVSAPRSRVWRTGALVEIPVEEIVADDVVEVQAGDQLPVDGVVEGVKGLEVDESLLTGEADPVRKAPGDEVLSGSFVAAGSGRFRATRVGHESYASQLAEEARRFETVHSELRQGIDQILRIVTWLIVPTGVLLVANQLRNDSLFNALRGSVAGIGSMIPEGLVLLTSLAFAVGVMRLARRNTLVQELPAIEILARVDVVCVDKTGTLTEGSLVLADVEHCDDAALVDEALGALAATEERPNASMQAVAAGVVDPGWRSATAVPFSSARKWSGASFEGGRGTWLIGAPDVLIGDGDGDDELRARVAELASTGRRVLLVARSDAALAGEELPAGLRPAALVVLEERVRAEAPDTIAFFREQGVEVKVISGDHPQTVGAVAAAVGVDVSRGPVDARELPAAGEDLAQMVEDHNVFGRVTPHQKRAMVQTLQARGHVVAMTGDGVNDVLALKEADIGVAMGAGSGASRGVAQMVLLDDSFATLPGVVAEGRRVIANVERVANLFVTKSVYAFFLSVTVGLAGVPFPFFPRHLTVVSSLTIGIPAFFLALAPNASRARPGFTGRVLRFALPAGAVAAGATFAGYAIAMAEPGVTTTEARTTAVLVLFGVAMWVLAILARPVDEGKAVLLGSMVALFVLVMALPPTRSFFELNAPHGVLVMAAIGVVACANALLESGWRLAGWGSRRWGRRPEPWNGQAASAASEPDAADTDTDGDGDGARRSA